MCDAFADADAAGGPFEVVLCGPPTLSTGGVRTRTSLMLTLQQLHYILLVSETRNFGKAARKAGVSQSAISQTIAAAEKKAGVSRFIRDKHGVTITEAGRLVSDRAEAILNDVAEVGAQIEAQRTARSGRVRFGIAPIPASIVLVPALTQYVRRFPGVHPEFTVEFWETLLPKLLTGDISFFIAGRYTMLDDRRLTRRSLFREPLVIAARPGHPLAAGSAVDPSDLVRYPLISHREPREIGDVIRRRLRDASELEMMRGNFPAAQVHDLRPYFSIVERPQLPDAERAHDVPRHAGSRPFRRDSDPRNRHGNLDRYRDPDSAPTLACSGCNDRNHRVDRRRPASVVKVSRRSCRNSGRRTNHRRPSRSIQRPPAGVPG